MPQLVKPTTPTSAGFAQVFDISGIREYTDQKEREKNANIEKLMTEFNTQGVLSRDIPHLQRQIAEFQNFTSKNLEALSSPADNIETWQEYQRLQGDIKNTIVYSTNLKEQIKQGTNLYMNSSNGMYFTDNNKNVLANIGKTPTEAQYADGSAWVSPTDMFDRNYDLKFQEYANIAQDQFKATAPEDTGNTIAGKVIYSQGAKLEREDVAAALQHRWTAKSLEGSSLRDNYGNDYNAFVDDVMAMTQEPTKYGLADPETTKATKQTANDRGREAAVLFTPNSRQSYHEAKFESVTKEGGLFSPDETAVMPIKYTNEDGTESPSLSTYGFKTTGSGAMMFKPMKIMKNVINAYDATTGEILEAGEGKRYKYQYPVERANYVTSNGTFELHYKDDSNKSVIHKFKKGEPVPDVEAMLKDNKITQNEYDRISGYLDSSEGYMVYASNENIDYHDLASSENVQNMLKKGGMRLMMVPLESLDLEVDQALMDEYGVNQQWYIERERQRRGQSAQSSDNYLDF